MSKRLIQDLHAGISRRDWSAVEAAASRLRDDVEQTVAILSGTSIGSLPNDYPLSKLAAGALNPSSTEVLPVDDIAEVLFNQRGTKYRWADAIEADADSDEGTLASIARDDARAVLAILGGREARP